MVNLVKINLSDLPQHCFINQAHRSVRGTIHYPEGHEGQLDANIRLAFHGLCERYPEDANVSIILKSIPGMGLSIGTPNVSIEVGENCQGNWSFNFFAASSVKIGNGCTSNGTNVICSGDISFGDDCMMAHDITIHVGDNHALVDVKTGEVINADDAKVVIGDHVWIGAGVRILKGAIIQDGCVVGASSLVTAGEYKACSIIAGTPARVVRSDTSWTRSVNGDGWEDVKSAFAF